jgi:hypothetical protein
MAASDRPGRPTALPPLQISFNVAPSDGGIEIEETAADITQPFDPTKIRIETKPLTIDLLLSRIKEGEINLTPDFQRKGGIWSDGAQSRLIESLLIRIPLPAFYMDATDEEHWLVVDGLQRLTTLKRFVLDRTLRLEGLEFLTKLQGISYPELPRSLQRRIRETQVTVYLIEKGTPPTLKFNIFKRINTGGLPLSSQEIRHALYQGKATSLLASLAQSDEFQSATARGISDERMADRECVLRFIAFSLTPYPEYETNDLDSFLNDTMRRLNEMSEKQLAMLQQKFIRTMIACAAIFGNKAFRKLYPRSHGRYPINRALFESWSVSIGQLDGIDLKTLVENRMQLIERFRTLMTNRDFEAAVSQGTGDARKVRLRFSAIETLVRGSIS